MLHFETYTAKLVALYAMLRKVACSLSREPHCPQTIEKGFETDICRALRDVPFESDTLNQVHLPWLVYVAKASKTTVSMAEGALQVIAEHLFQAGRFDVGETFIREAGLKNGDSLKQAYQFMHHVLQEVRPHVMFPAVSSSVAKLDCLNCFEHGADQEAKPSSCSGVGGEA